MKPSEPVPGPTASVLRTAWAVFAVTAALLLLTTGGHTYAIDEELMLAATYGLVERGNFTLSAEPDATVSVYGPGQSVAAAPLLWLALQLAPLLSPAAEAWLVRAVLSWFNPLVTAATAACFVPLLTRRGFSAGVAAATGLIYALATMAWPHSKTFFAEPLTALLLMAALTLADGARRPFRLVAAGLLAGLALAVKIHAAICLPAFGLAVLYPAAAARDWRRLLRDGLSWGGGAAIGLMPLLLYQWLQFGNPLVTGYGSGAGSVLRNDLLFGLYGLLFSPGKSLLLYAPPLLLLPWVLVRLFRRDAALTVLILSQAVINLVFYALLLFWHGDGAWGPRYLNIVLPLLVLPLAEIAAQVRQSRRARSALAATLIAAVPLQLGALTINLNAYLTVQPVEDVRRLTVAGSPILGHLRMLSEQLQRDLSAQFSRPAVWLRDGWSYSEGDRERAEQLPRWTTGTAAVELRPQGPDALRLDLLIDGCRPSPLDAQTPLLGVGGRPAPLPAACPPRRVQLLLPPAQTTLTVGAAGWLPREVGIERNETLGVLIRELTVSQGGRPLPLLGRLVPPGVMPADPGDLRRWYMDYRIGHYDLWWAQLPSAPLSGPQRLVTLLIWCGIPALLLVAGLRELRGLQRR